MNTAAKRAPRHRDYKAITTSKYRIGDPDLLSPRERELHTYMMTKLSGKEIGYRMGITWHTTKIVSIKVCNRLGVSGRIELMAREIDILRHRIIGLERMLSDSAIDWPEAA